MTKGKPHDQKSKVLKSTKPSRKKGARKKAANGHAGDKPRCGALTKQCRACQHRYGKGERALSACPKCGEPRPCESDELFSNGRCRRHGGSTPSGPASANFKHGLYSKAWELLGLKELLDRTAEADLLDSTEAMRSLQARILFLMEQGHGVELFEEIADQWKRLKDAGRAKDDNAQRIAAAALDSLVAQGVDESGRWKEIYRLEEQMDRMRQRAHRRAVDAEMLVSLQMVISLTGGWLFAIKAIIRRELEALGVAHAAKPLIDKIGREYEGLVGRGNARGLVGRGEGSE